jgi:hypothetical protein
VEREVTMELHMHEAGKEGPHLVELEPTQTVAEVGGKSAEGEEFELWLEDEDEPLDRSQTLEQAGIGDRQHVHRSRCRRIVVTARYAGREPIEKPFGPAKTIKQVFHWATGEHGFPLTPEQRAKHVLALPDADHYLAWTVHVGSLADPATCSVTLELYPKERFEG